MWTYPQLHADLFRFTKENLKRKYHFLWIEHTEESIILSNNTSWNENTFKGNTITCFETYRSSHPEVFLGKGVLKTCSKFTGEHPCRSVISIKLKICCIFSEQHLLRIPLDGCFWTFLLQKLILVSSAKVYSSKSVFALFYLSFSGVKFFWYS